MDITTSTSAVETQQPISPTQSAALSSVDVQPIDEAAGTSQPPALDTPVQAPQQPQSSLAQRLQAALSAHSVDNIQQLLVVHDEFNILYDKCLKAESSAKERMKADFDGWWQWCAKLQQLYTASLSVGTPAEAAKAWSVIKTTVAEERQLKDKDELQKYRQLYVDLITWLPDETRRAEVLQACPTKNKMRGLMAHFRKLQKNGELETSNTLNLKDQMVGWFVKKRRAQEAELADTRLAIERAPEEAVLQTQALERAMQALMKHFVLKDTDVASIQHVVAAIQTVCGDSHSGLAAALVDVDASTSDQPRSTATRGSKSRRQSRAQIVQSIRTELTEKYAPASDGNDARGASVADVDDGFNQIAGEDTRGDGVDDAASEDAEDEEAEADFLEAEEEAPVKRRRLSRRIVHG